MPEHVPCPSCGKKLRVPKGSGGAKLRCPACGRQLLGGASEEDARETADYSLAPEEKAPPSPKPVGSRSSKGKSVPPSSSATLPEQIGRFLVRDQLGAGAFGAVYRAYDPELEREVALKVPHPGTLDTPKAVQRFLREAKAAAQLRHPNIVPVYESGSDGTRYFITSAFIDGKTLARAIDENQLGFRKAARIVRELAAALAYAHGLGIVHRDVKPANIMLEAGVKAHLMDFGLAHRHDLSGKLTRAGAVLGTPAYMAPEQAAGQKGDPLPASDQYSLGVVLYELLCGGTPFEGPPEIVLFNAIHTEPAPPRKVNAAVPVDLETVCLKAMAKDPEHRYADCEELAADLGRWLDGEPIRARPVGRLERLARWGRRNQALVLAGAAAFLFLAVGVVVWAFYANRLARAREREAQVAQEKGELEQQQDVVRTEAVTKAKAEADKEVARVSELEKSKQERQKRGLAYARDIGLARQALANAQYGQARELLARLRPAEGQDDLRGFEWYYLWRWSRTERFTFKAADEPQHGGSRDFTAHHLAFSPDGKQLVAGGRGAGAAALGRWDVASGQGGAADLDKDTVVNRMVVSAVSFTPDGRGVALASAGKAYVRAEAGGGGEVKTEFQQAVTGVAFAPDRLLLATAIIDGSVRLWNCRRWQDGTNDLGTWELIRTLNERPLRPDETLLGDPAANATPLLFSPLGTLLARGNKDRGVTFFARRGDQWQPHGDLKGLTERLSGLDFSPDGQTLATVSTGGALQLWDVDKLAEKPALNVGQVRAVAYSRSAPLMTLGAEDGGVKLWDLRANRELAVFRGHRARVRAVAFSPDGLLLASAGDDKLVKLWDLTLAWAGPLPLGPGTNRAGAAAGPRTLNFFSRLVISPDGKTLAAEGGGDPRLAPQGAVQLWDLSTGKSLAVRQRLAGPFGFAPDGKTLLNYNGLYNVVSGYQQGWGPLPRGEPIAFSPDGSFLAMHDSSNYQIQLFDVQAKQPGPLLKQDELLKGVQLVAFDAAGKTLVANNDAGVVTTWDTTDGKLRRKLALVERPFEQSVQTIGVSPDGTLLAGRIMTRGTVGLGAEEASPVKLWDLTTGQVTATLEGEARALTCSAFSPDGKTLAAGQEDGTVRLWSLSTGQELIRLQDGPSRITSLAFTPDSRTLLVAAQDGSLKQWLAARDR